MGSIFGKIGEETPKFELESTHEVEVTGPNGQPTLVKFEIRKYAPNVEVTTAAGQFMTLAKYIGVATRTPANHDPNDASKREFVPMTAPVVQRPADKKEAGTMSFVLPSKFTADTAPTPTNPLVKVEQMPGRRMAVIQFNGSAAIKDDRVARKAQELKRALEKCAIATLQSDEWELYSYNPPWSISYFKRNEVAFCLNSPVDSKVVLGETVKEEAGSFPGQAVSTQ